MTRKDTYGSYQEETKKAFCENPLCFQELMEFQKQNSDSC